jgi:SAM-dependent methyltransferase
VTNKFTDPDVWWQEYSGHYATRSWKDYRPLLAEFVSFAEEPPLLDVGCGYGFLVECARQFGIQAIGLEAGSSALDFCKRTHPLADIRPWKGGEDLPVASASIGGVVLNEFIDHITLKQNELLFRELTRVLKPNGVLLVKSPSKYNRFDQDEGHVTFFSPSEFREFVQSFFFDVLDQPYYPQPILGPSRLASLAVSLATKVYKPEKWSARIDLIARKRRIPEPEVVDRPLTH